MDVWCPGVEWVIVDGMMTMDEADDDDDSNGSNGAILETRPKGAE